MPKGVHNNHKGGRKPSCNCGHCPKCNSRRWYQKHRVEHLIRQMDRYYQNKRYSESDLEKKLIAKFKKEGWDA